MHALLLSLSLWLGLSAAPDPLYDLYRFPSRPAAEAAFYQAWDFEENSARCATPEAWRYTQRAEYAWCLLENAHDGSTVALAELRSLLGEEDYWTGRMPYPVPLWALEELP